MFAVSPTDKGWFDHLKNNKYNSYVNFWTPTPWNVRKKIDELCFMLKSPIRKIGGYGEYLEYANMTVSEAWNEFGNRNGCVSKQELVDRVQNYIDKNSQKFGGKGLDIDNYQIGCIILNNCVFWDDEFYKDIGEYNIEFGKEIVTLKYFELDNPFLCKNQIAEDFKIVSTNRDNKKSTVNRREGQSEFKSKILIAYNHKCCVTGEIIPELLEAAHIQKYLSNLSNHVQNGLLLRTDIHKLFDSGLIFIDENYIIHVSDIITNPFYSQYHGRKIILPKYLFNYPSKDALKIKEMEFRVKQKP